MRLLFGIACLTFMLAGCGKDDDSKEKEEPGTEEAGTDDNSSGTVTDIDGNVYHTVTIGTQTWMVENLRTTKYRDGTSIPLVNTKATWTNLTSAAYCLKTSSDKAEEYGCFYNIYAFQTGLLAPTGWHCASGTDWDTLKKYLADRGYGYGGSGTDIAQSLAWTADWLASTGDKGDVGYDLTKNNTSGFSGYPVGCRKADGSYGFFGERCCWWSGYPSYNFETHVTSYQYILLSYDEDEVGVFHALPTTGMSIRCVKD